MQFNAKISFTIDAQHPNIKYVKDWTEEKVLTFSDTYTFNENFYSDEVEEMISYIKSDLKLIAGGGYNSEHIHNITFEINRL